MATSTRSKQQRPNKQQQQKTQAPMARRVEATLNRLEKKDPGLREFLKKAHGYAVFPAVGKASLVVGGAHGHGGVFERGKFIGHATLSQITLGVQLGGDTFTEILAFHDKGSLDRFKKGHMTFTASASAVLVKAGASATSNFKGVTAHAYSSGGMLLELAIGGQKFTFKPLGDKQGGPSEDGGGKGQSQRGGEDEEAEGEGEDEQGEGGGLGQVLSNARSAVDGVRGAASKVGDLAREHPVAATLIGAGLTTGLAFLVVRAMRQAQSSSESEEDQGDDQEDDDQDSDARGESDDYEDDEGGGGDDDDREEEDDDHPALSRRGRARA